MNRFSLLEKAVEITKEYARGGGSRPPAIILEEVYTKLKELNEDLKKEQ